MCVYQLLHSLREGVKRSSAAIVEMERDVSVTWCVCVCVCVCVCACACVRVRVCVCRSMSYITREALHLIAVIAKRQMTEGKQALQDTLTLAHSLLHGNPQQVRPYISTVE